MVQLNVQRSDATYGAGICPGNKQILVIMTISCDEHKSLTTSVNFQSCGGYRGHAKYHSGSWDLDQLLHDSRLTQGHHTRSMLLNGLSLGLCYIPGAICCALRCEYREFKLRTLPMSSSLILLQASIFSRDLGSVDGGFLCALQATTGVPCESPLTQRSSRILQTGCP